MSDVYKHETSFIRASATRIPSSFSDELFSDELFADELFADELFAAFNLSFFMRHVSHCCNARLLCRPSNICITRSFILRRCMSVVLPGLMNDLMCYCLSNLQNFNDKQHVELRLMLVEMVLGTDMSKHFQELNEFKNLASTKVTTNSCFWIEVHMTVLSGYNGVSYSCEIDCESDCEVHACTKTEPSPPIEWQAQGTEQIARDHV